MKTSLTLAIMKDEKFLTYRDDNEPRLHMPFFMQQDVHDGNYFKDAVNFLNKINIPITDKLKLYDRFNFEEGGERYNNSIYRLNLDSNSLINLNGTNIVRWLSLDGKYDFFDYTLDQVTLKTFQNIYNREIVKPHQDKIKSNGNYSLKELVR